MTGEARRLSAIGGALNAALAAAALAGALALASALAPAPARAQSAGAADGPRVVSLDYCADQYVIGLADRAQILALSPGARADYSAERAAAEGLPTMRPDAEAVLALEPDLVIAAHGADARARALFERAGIALHQIGFARDFDDLEANIAAAGEALGRPEAAARRIAAMRADLAAASAPGAPQRRALYVTPGGVTAAQGTLVDALLEAAGFVNIAAEAGRSGWIAWPLERLVTAPPDLVAAAFFDTATTRADNWSLARHGAMQALLEDADVIELDAAHLACGTWRLAEAARSARAQADALARGPLAASAARAGTDG